MTPTHQGSIRLFQLAGIEVFLHWSWFLVALYEIQQRAGRYASPVWNVLEYLGLFAIVLLHEFGHSLACRQVGGRADRIVLWPLGGVAYVQPPERPGATLWSIAAGPLVNVILIPVFLLLGRLMSVYGVLETRPDLVYWLADIARVNLGLHLARMARAQRRAGLSCPACQAQPPVGAFWVCGHCQGSFDLFETQAVCPQCGAAYASAPCLACGRSSPMGEWGPSSRP